LVDGGTLVQKISRHSFSSLSVLYILLFAQIQMSEGANDWDDFWLETDNHHRSVNG
jgi:hypothetical protein